MLVTMEMAKLVSSWSKDPSTKVGCVIVDKSNRVVSLGFNGLPVGLNDHRHNLEDSSYKKEIIIHAEENALLFANTGVVDCTVYVYPFLPCSRCTGKLIQAGISRVVSMETDREDWNRNFEISKKLLKEAGVKFNVKKKDWV